MKDLGSVTGTSVEQVRRCRSCGFEIPEQDATRCGHCWILLTGIAPLYPEGEVVTRAWWLRLFSIRVLFGSLAFATVFGLVVWWLVAYFQLGPPPPEATTGLTSPEGSGIWAQVRSNARNSGFTPEPAPVPDRVKWTFAAAEPMASGPVVVDGRVYLSTGDGHTVALDHTSGQVIWEYTTGLPSSSTPAVAGDLVIAAYIPGLIAALDRDTGIARWEVDLNQPLTASPIIANGTLYFGAGDGQLYTLDAATGEELWSFLTSDWIDSPVAYFDDTVIVATQGRRVYVVDANTGRQRLLFDSSFQRSGGGPTIQGDTVYFSGDRGWVWAIDRRAKNYPGQRKWFIVKINLYVWQMISRPIQHGSVWSRRVGGQITGLLALAHHAVFGATEEGMVFARDAASGDKRWSTELGVAISTAPTVAGDTVLVGTEDGTVFGLDATTGEVLWDFKVSSGEIADSPVVAGDTMYVVSEDGTLYAVTGAE